MDGALILLCTVKCGRILFIFEKYKRHSCPFSWYHVYNVWKHVWQKYFSDLCCQLVPWTQWKKHSLWHKYLQNR